KPSLGINGDSTGIWGHGCRCDKRQCTCIGIRAEDGDTRVARHSINKASGWILGYEEGAAATLGERRPRNLGKRSGRAVDSHAREEGPTVRRQVHESSCGINGATGA